MMRVFSARCSFLMTLVYTFWMNLPVMGEETNHAINVTTRTLTLAEAQNIAFQRNWDLLAARSDVDLATAQRIVARQFPNPTLSFSTTQISVDSHANATGLGNGLLDRSYDTTVAINQLFEIGGKRAQRKASAQAGLKASEARLADARRVLNQAVSKSYIEAVLAEANSKILADSAKSLRQEAGIAETRLKAGDISKAEKSQIEIASERLELQAATATATANSARIAVEVLLGTSHPTGEWAPGDTLESLAAKPNFVSQGPPGSLRPDLLAAEAAKTRADAELRLQRALRVPDPTLFLQYEHEPPDFPNTIGLGVSFPIPLWHRNQGGIASAKAVQEQAAVTARKLEAQIQAEIATARNAYADASARWQRHRAEIEPKSAEVRQTVSFAYEKGGASLLDLLSAQRTDNEVRLATAQAAAETAKAAADLKAALNLP